MLGKGEMPCASNIDHAYLKICNNKATRKGALWEAYWRRNILATQRGEETRIEFNPLPEDSHQEEFPFFSPPRNWAALGLPWERHVAMPIIELGPCLRFCAFNVEVNGAHFHLYLVHRVVSAYHVSIHLS